MKRKWTEVEYNQLSVETIISSRISSSTTYKYKGHLKRFANLLGINYNINATDCTTIDHMKTSTTGNIKISEKVLQAEESMLIRH